MQSVSHGGAAGRSAATFGIRLPYDPDESYPLGDILPTDTKTPFYGSVMRVDDGEPKEWGLAVQVPSKRDPTVKQTK